jgi:two-component system LytT family response regulator
VRVLIVDDEAPARAKLRRMLGLYDDVDVVGEAADGVEALALVARLEPHAIFLDVHMPALDGFGVAASLARPAPALVLVTAYEHHAVKAFEAEAADYLLKPVASERLGRTVQRLRALLCAEASSQGGTAAPRLLIVDRGFTHIVPLADIQWLESADNYVFVHTAGQTLLMRSTLAALLEDLGPGFVRIHRGAAVSVARVRVVRPRGKGDAMVVLHNGAELPCSRQHRPELMRRLTS